MKPLSRTVLTIVAASCGAIFLTPSLAPGAEKDFFQKFILEEPMNWSGFYVGFNNGATFNNFHVGKHMTDVDLTDQFYDVAPVTAGVSDFFATFDTPGHHHNDTETIGGAQTGLKFQFGHFVVGAEGSFIGNGTSATGMSHEFQEHTLFVMTVDQLQIPLDGGVIAETEFKSMHKIETTWNGFVGGNIGFAWNRFLFHGDGGVAFTDVHFESTDAADTSFFENCLRKVVCDGAVAPATVGRATGQQPLNLFIGEIVSKKTHTQGNVLTGWYGGGGIDFALTKIVSVGVEYKHVDWGDVTEHLMVGGNGGPVFPTNAKLNLDADQVVFKVNLLVGPIGH
jgi:opacity protein-like surface antigen